MLAGGEGGAGVEDMQEEGVGQGEGEDQAGDKDSGEGCFPPRLGAGLLFLLSVD